MKSFAVVAFAKEPLPGMVKSRLTPHIPPDHASYVYETLLLDTIDILITLRDAEKYIFFTPDGSSYFAKFSSSGFRLVPQGAGDLGERMKRACSHVMSETGKPTLIVGTDTPLLTGEIIRRGAHMLSSHDIVVGPSEDGGYYLLGTSKPAPHLFDGISWSTRLVFDETMKKCEESGLSVELLPTLFDIDRPEDIVKFAVILEKGEIGEEVKRSRFSRLAPKLARYLLGLLRGE